MVLNYSDFDLNEKATNDQIVKALKNIEIELLYQRGKIENIENKIGNIENKISNIENTLKRNNIK